MKTLANQCLQEFSGGTPGAIRTHGLQSRSLSLYPSELRAHVALRVAKISHFYVCVKVSIAVKTRFQAQYSEQLFDIHTGFVLQLSEQLFAGR